MNSALLRTVAKSAVRVPKVNVQPIRKMGGDGHDHVHVSWRSWDGQAQCELDGRSLGDADCTAVVDLGGGDSGCEAYESLPPAAVCFFQTAAHPPSVCSRATVALTRSAPVRRRSLPDAPPSIRRAALPRLLAPTSAPPPPSNSRPLAPSTARRRPVPPPWSHA